jgi:hypothetical protein
VTASQFLKGLLQAQRYGKDQAQRVLALLGSYARQDLIAALERAVRYEAFSHAAVERILSFQARPKSGLETLAEDPRRSIPPWLDDTPVSPRPMSDYQHLGDQEPRNHDAPNPSPSDTNTHTEADASGAAPADP